MKQIILSLLSLLAGLLLFLCSLFVQNIIYSLLCMGISVLFLLLTIGILSYDGTSMEVDHQKSTTLY
jgi:uncharacterized membrane protein SpoIIM required for sporulation